MQGESGLINFIFKENNATLDMHLGGLETTKDLFKFCMHFLWKGLVLLYGDKDDDSVDLEMLSFDDFLAVQQKLKNVGIRCNLDVTELDEVLDPANIPNINLQILLNTVQLETDGDQGKRLPDYSFELQTSKHILKISFDIFHSVPPLSKHVARL
jgi:hypothetical protein